MTGGIMPMRTCVYPTVNTVILVSPVSTVKARPSARPGARAKLCPAGRLVQAARNRFVWGDPEYLPISSERLSSVRSDTEVNPIAARSESSNPRRRGGLGARLTGARPDGPFGKATAADDRPPPRVLLRRHCARSDVEGPPAGVGPAGDRDRGGAAAGAGAGAAGRAAEAELRAPARARRCLRCAL